MKTIRDFKPASRYVYDFGECSTRNGFAQVDTEQDASYFGTWANPEKRAIVSYCEGDVTIQIAETQDEFVAELNKIKEFTENLGYRFLGIDPGFNEDLKSRFESIGLGNLLH